MVDLSRLAQNKFLVFGRAGMDLYPDPPGTRTKEASQFFACLGGSSANIAVALTRHGSIADLVTSVSNDAVGHFVLDQLDKYNVGRDFVKLVDGEVRTSLAVVESRVEDHQSVIYRNNAADFEVQTPDFSDLDFTQYGALILTGTALAGEPSKSATMEAISRAKLAGLPIIFDVDYRPYSWPSDEVASATYREVAEQCTIVVGNDDEFGVMANDYDQGQAYAEQLSKSCSSIAVYKMGQKGSVTFADGEAFRTGIYAVKALKPTGAGDAFMGSFVAALAQGKPLQTAVQHGSAAAAYVVERVGCAPAMPNTKELENFINNHSGLSAA
ncbi:5-dehydro-2-deoxygluconokinase [Maritalea sp.]|uniref:5-dehydro-2-deoxygluconokinase n=1 Tax=Maritalea sp. TaxID=2003361 RepID=UPI003EF94EB0